MSPLAVFFDGPGMLVMRTGLSANWGRIGHSYGFSVQHKIEYRGGWSIRAQLTFRASPPGAGRAASLFPDAAVAGGDQLVGWTIKDSVITFRVALKFEQPWRIMSTGRPGLFFEAGPLLRGADGSRLHVQGLLVFHEPDPAPIPDVHVWSEKMFVSGGQFESNRRRH